mmetsp:Transcript_13290/g.39622  ORF Transcript_13290/g.39622 Transcript_13290/m.39622 type:complete len:317 (-) Transcript_13290:106-1056(-)
MADARPDLGEAFPVHVFAVPGHPRQGDAALPGHVRVQDHVQRGRPVPSGAHPSDVGRARWIARALRGARLGDTRRLREGLGQASFRAEGTDPGIFGGDCVRGARESSSGTAVAHLERERHDRGVRVGVCGHREIRESRGGIVRPVQVGGLRPPGAATQLSLRRHGESLLDIRDADVVGQGPVAGPRRGPRGCSFVEREPCHERDMGTLLAQRGLDRVHRAEDYPRGVRRRGSGVAVGQQVEVLSREREPFRKGPQFHEARARPLGGRRPRRRLLHRALHQGHVAFLPAGEARRGRGAFPALLAGVFRPLRWQDCDL